MADYSGDAPITAGYAPNPVQGGGSRIKERVKSVSYSQADNKLLLDVESAQTESATKVKSVGEVHIANTGKHPAFAVLAYRLWTLEGTMGATYHVSYLLRSGESITIPDCPALIQDDGVEQFDGELLTNQVPHSNMYTASTCLLNEASNINDSVTAFTVDSGNWFRVGDLIRIDDEIMEITGIDTNELTVLRAVSGSDAASHNDDAPIRFPFFNKYHEFDKFSVAQTDSGGAFWAKNFFGYGRATTLISGITPGSVALKFYTQCVYQELGMNGIHGGTESGLTSGTVYAINITVDGGSQFTDLSWTVDSTKFGGATGVIQKIQDALDAKFYTSGNLFEKKVNVAIVQGDIRFTSGSHLSSSAISLASATGASSETNFFGVGRVTAIGSIEKAVAARLPDDSVYDKETYSSSPNSSAFAYDDGRGNLSGACSGSINYETGEIILQSAPINAEFVVSALYNGPFSGKKTATGATKMNSLKAIYGNMPNQKGAGELTITRR